MREPENEPQIGAIARRLSDFLARQPDFEPSSFATQAGVTEGDLRTLLAPQTALTDPAVLIDVIVEVVPHYGVDANWLLTGEHDPRAHRKLDEEGRLGAAAEIRRLVADWLRSWSLLQPAAKFPA